MINKIGKNRFSKLVIAIFTLLFSLFSLTLFENISRVFASSQSGLGFSSEQYLFLESESNNYLYLDMSEDLKQNIPFNVGYTINSNSTAIYGTNFTSIVEGQVEVVLFNEMPCILLNSNYQDSYDTGKFAQIELFSLDENEYSVFDNAKQATITIKDKNPDGFVAITTEDKIVFENEGTTTFTVQCSPNFFGVTVGLKYQGTAVFGEDYTAPLAVTIPAGETTKDVTINLIDNDTKQNIGREIFVYLDSVTESAEIAAIPNNTSVTIKDDESIGIISFSKETDEVVEQDGDYILLIERKNGTEGDLTFNLTLSSTATFGQQYKNDVSGEYTLYDGEASKVVRLKFAEDTIYTGKETFTFNLTQKQGENVEFDITTLVLTRFDTISPSNITIEAPSLDEEEYGFNLVRDNSQTQYTTLKVIKAVGGRVDFKYLAKIAGDLITDASGNFIGTSAQQSTIDSILGELKLNEVISISSENYSITELLNFTLLKSLSSDINLYGYIGRVTLSIKFYDANAETTINGQTEYTLNLTITDTADNGVYKIGDISRDGNNIKVNVRAVTPCTISSVNGTLEMFNGTNLLASQEVSFSPITAGVIRSFPLSSESYNIITSNIQTVTFKLTMTTVGASASVGEKDFDALKGAGGIVGFATGKTYLKSTDYNFSYGVNVTVLHITENQEFEVKLVRSLWDNLPALQVPIYIKNTSSYFANILEPIAYASFTEGQTEAFARFTPSLDHQILSAENNYLYIKSDAYEYSTINYSQENLLTSVEWPDYFYHATCKEYPIEIRNSEDYGVVGFDSTTYSLTVTEGENISLPLKKVGGLDTPVSAYISETNLPKTIAVPSVTVTNNGAIISFSYDDDVWTDYLTQGYMKITLIRPVGDAEVNSSGLISGAETFTVFVKENEKLLNLTFDGIENSCMDGANIEVQEKNHNTGSFIIFANINMFTSNTESVFQLQDLIQIYATTPNGQEQITNYNTIFKGKDITFSYIAIRVEYNYSASQEDIVFNLHIVPARTDVEIDEDYQTLKVTVKNRISVSEISSQIASNVLNETTERTDIVLTRTNAEADKLINVILSDSFSVRFDNVKILVNEIEISNNQFTWNKNVESLTLSIIWTDNNTYDNANSVQYVLNFTSDNISFTPIVFGVLDDEIDASLEFENYDVYTENNPLIVNINKNNFYVYFSILGSTFPEDKTVVIDYNLTVLTPNMDTRIYFPYQSTCSNSNLYVDCSGVINNFFSEVKFKLEITGCNYNIEISENNLNKRTIYFTVKMQDTILNIAFENSNKIYERFDESELKLVRTGTELTSVKITPSLSVDAVNAGFTIDKTTLNINSNEQFSDKLKLIAPSGTASSLENLTITFLCEVYNPEGTEKLYEKTVYATYEVYSDGDYVFTLDKSTAEIIEGENLTFKVTRGQSARIGYVTCSISALDNRIAASSVVLNFAAYETEKTIILTSLNDKLINSGNSFTISLSDPTGGADKVDIGVLTVSVKDNDFIFSNASVNSYNEIFKSFIVEDFDNNGIADVGGILSDGTFVIYLNYISNSVKLVGLSKLSSNSVVTSVNYDNKNYVIVASENEITLIKINENNEIIYYNYSVDYDFNENSIVIGANCDETNNDEICFINENNKTKLFYYSISENGVNPSSSSKDINFAISKMYKTYDGSLVVVGAPYSYNDGTNSYFPFTVLNGIRVMQARTYKSEWVNNYLVELNSNLATLGKTPNSFGYGNINNQYVNVGGFAVAKIIKNNSFEYVLVEGTNTQKYAFGVNNIVEYVVSANITNDDEFFVKINGNLYALFLKDGNYVLSDALAEGIDDLGILDLYNNGKNSVYYTIDGKLYIIENPYNHTTINVVKTKITAYDSDNYVQIQLSRTGSINRSHSVLLTTVDGSAIKNIDYKPMNINVIFAPGETTKTIQVYLKDIQDYPTNSKMFYVYLSSDNETVEIINNNAEITIIDTDNSGNVFFENSEIFYNENEGTVYIQVKRTKNVRYGLFVDYSILDNASAKIDEDYSAILDGTLEFTAGEYVKTIAINLINDDIFNILHNKSNLNRYFTIVLSNPRCNNFDYTNYSDFAPKISEYASINVFVLDDETAVENADITDNGDLEDQTLNQNGDEILARAYGNNTLVATTYDFDNNGREDSFTFINNVLSFQMNIGFIDEYSYSKTIASLRWDMNFSFGFENCEYVQTLNQFVFYELNRPKMFAYSVQTNSSMQIQLVAASNVICLNSSVFKNRQFSFGDFDGDKKIDLLSIENTDVYYALSSNSYTLEFKQTLDIDYSVPFEVYVLDLNGDKVDDIVINQKASTHGYGCAVYALNSTTTLGNFSNFSNIYRNGNSKQVFFIRLEHSGNYAIIFVGEYHTDYAIYFVDSFDVKFAGSGLFKNNTTGKTLDENWFGTPAKINLYRIDSTGEYFIHSLVTWEGYGENIITEWDIYAKLVIQSKAVSVSTETVSETNQFAYITINNPSGLADTLNYYCVEGTAVNNGDYVGVKSSINFAEGEYSKTIQIRLNDNTYYDGNKEFYVVVYNSLIGQELFNNVAKVKILDNEDFEGTNNYKKLYIAGDEYIFTANVSYDVHHITFKDGNGNILQSNGKSITVSVENSGSQTLILSGYDANGMRIYYSEILAEVVPANSELKLEIQIPNKVTENTEIDVVFTALVDNDGVSFPVGKATISFYDAMNAKNVTLITNNDGRATYKLKITSGDYGTFLIAATLDCYLGNVTNSANYVLDNPNSKISGYILLPDANIGASGIVVKIGNLTATTNQSGYFEIQVTSGYNYTLVVNPNNQNSFYKEKIINISHTKSTTIISQTLENADNNSLDFKFSYFYYDYSGGYDEYDYEVKYFRYALPKETTRYESGNITMENRFSTVSELPLYTVMYPSNTRTAYAKTSSGRWVTGSTWGSKSYMNWYDWNLHGNFKSRTELYFEFPTFSVPDYYKDFEFVVCDAYGNTLRVLDDVSYEGIQESTYKPLYEARDAARNNGCQDFIFEQQKIHLENYIKLTVDYTDVNEDERLYIRRITNNDVFYYYTGLSFGRSLAEKTRDDIGSKFAEVATKPISGDLSFLEGTIFSIDLFTSDYAMVKNEAEQTAIIYLGFATASRNLDDIPLEYSSNVSIMSPPGTGLRQGFSANSSNSVKIYFGGIFELEYNEENDDWRYVSGSAKFYGKEESETRLNFTFTLGMGISVYIFTTIGHEFSSNISVNVEDSELKVYGNTESEVYIEAGHGLSVAIAKAELWIRATGEFYLYFGEIQGTRLDITINGGATFYFLWFKYRSTWYNVRFSYDQTYTPPVVEPEETTLEDIENSNYAGYCVDVDENGVLIGTIRDVTELPVTTLVEESTVDAQPVTIDFGNKTMNVYKQTVENSNGIEYDTLFYSVKNGSVWSSPKTVCTLTRDISEFSVSLYNNMPVIAFSHTTTGGTLSEQMKNVDISVAYYNELSNNFALESITNDNLPDSAPVIGADNGKMVLVYNKTYRVDYTQDLTLADALFSDREMNYIMYCEYNQANKEFADSKILYRGAYNSKDNSLTIVENKAYYSFLADQDGNISTENDVDVLCFTYDFNNKSWSEPVNISNSSAGETAVYSLNVDNQIVFLWLNKYGINIKYNDADATVINTREQGDITKFIAKEYNNEILIAWTEAITNIEDKNSNFIYFLIADLNGNIGIRKVLTSTSGIILDYDVIMRNNSVYVVYNRSVASTEENERSYSIIGTEVNYVQNTGVQNVYTASGRFRTDTTEKFFFDVVNTGTINLTNLRVTVRENNQTGNVLYNALLQELKRGAVKTMSFSTIISENMYGLFITVENEPVQRAVSAGNVISAQTCVFALSNVERFGVARVINVASEQLGISMRQEKINLQSVDTLISNNKVKLIIHIDNTGDLATSGTARISHYLAGNNWIKTANFTLEENNGCDLVVELTYEELRGYLSANNTTNLVVSLASETATFENYATTVYTQLANVYRLIIGNTDLEYITLENGVIQEPEIPTKQGYLFGGWYKDSNFTEVCNFPVTLTEDTTIYVKWIPNNGNYGLIFIILTIVLLLSSSTIFIILWKKKIIFKNNQKEEK